MTKTQAKKRLEELREEVENLRIEIEEKINE